MNYTQKIFFFDQSKNEVKTNKLKMKVLKEIGKKMLRDWMACWPDDDDDDSFGRIVRLVVGSR